VASDEWRERKGRSKGKDFNTEATEKEIGRGRIVLESRMYGAW